MSKLLKSKILLGVMIVAVMLVGVAVATTAKAADCTLTTTLKQTMKGAEVTCLQTKLGMTTVTGYFGSMTKAAVQAFQTNNGLTADGVVGPMTRAALNAGGSTGGNTTTEPLCPNGMTLASNCQTAPGGSTTTEPLCPNGKTLASNCQTDPAGGTTPSNLTGGAGDLTLTQTSSDTETDILEGATEKVLAFRAEADGSDVAISNMKIWLSSAAYNFSSGTDFTATGSGSNRIERYMTEVTVWDGSTKVATIPVSEFNKDGNLYSKSISLSDVVVKDGSANKKTFYVALTALSNIDTGDLTKGWGVRVDGIRYQDATGMVMTSSDSVTVNGVDFDDSSTSSDIKLKVSKDSTNPASGNVEASDSGSTSDVPMLVFKLKAEGTDMTLDSMVFSLDSTDATADQVISEIGLYKGTEKLGDVTSIPATSASANVTMSLYDTLTLTDGDTATFKVLAKVKQIGTTTASSAVFDQGDALNVDLGSFTDLVEDSYGNNVTNISGTAIGEDQYFYSEGITVSDFTNSASATTDQNGKITKQTYAISFKVTAFGNTYYIPRSVSEGTTASDGLVYTVENSAGTTIAAASNTIVAAAPSLSSTATLSGSYYEIPEGETRTFTTTISLTKGVSFASTGFYRAQLGAVRYDTDTSGTPTSYSLVPANNFETADRELTY